MAYDYEREAIRSINSLIMKVQILTRDIDKVLPKAAPDDPKATGKEALRAELAALRQRLASAESSLASEREALTEWRKNQPVQV
jgi:hypothetical protein